MPQLGHAGSGEHGGLNGNVAGNQRKLTGNPSYNDEVKITGWWYNPSRTLRSVYRFKDKNNAKRLAQAMINACNNPHIGYDQSDRHSLTRQLERVGFSVDGFSKITSNCETDCSALVADCIRAVTGVNLGDLRTGNMDEKFKATGLFTVITGMNEQQKRYGTGFLIGDICLFSGHTAVVVSEDDTTIISSQQAPQILQNEASTQRAGLIYGTPNVVVVNDKIYGQTKDYSVKSSVGPLQIKCLDGNKLRTISKVVVVDGSGIARMVYGFDKKEIPFAFVGDGRIVQLGKSILDKGNSNYNLQYAFTDDDSVFAKWGALLSHWKSSLFGGRIQIVDSTKQLVQEAAKKEIPNAIFWLGINDIQTHKTRFTNSSSDDFIDEWVRLYADLIDYYRDGFNAFDIRKNKIYIASIVTTSKSNKKYYSEQGDVIKKVNAKLKEYVELTQEAFIEQTGEDAENCWLQFIDLNVTSSGQPYSNVQGFVSSSDFEEDGIHFKKDWYVDKFLTRFNFSEFVGDEPMFEEGGVTPPTPAPSPGGEVVPTTTYNKIDPIYIYNFIRAKGYSSAFAIGIIGNIKQECDFKVGDCSDINVRQEITINGVKTGQKRNPGAGVATSFGLIQWHNAYWEQTTGTQHGFGKRMMDYCANHGGYWQTNADGQLSYLLNTMLDNSLSGGHFSTTAMQKFAEMRLMANTLAGAREIAKIFVQYYEEPPDMENEKNRRANFAEQFWHQIIG